MRCIPIGGTCDQAPAIQHAAAWPAFGFGYGVLSNISIRVLRIGGYFKDYYSSPLGARPARKEGSEADLTFEQVWEWRRHQPEQRQLFGQFAKANWLYWAMKPKRRSKRAPFSSPIILSDFSRSRNWALPNVFTVNTGSPLGRPFNHGKKMQTQGH